LSTKTEKQQFSSKSTTGINELILTRRHWFSLIEGRKSYWAKVREIKKPI
jgi:hypothetical protein